MYDSREDYQSGCRYCGSTAESVDLDARWFGIDPETARCCRVPLDDPDMIDHAPCPAPL